MEFNASVGTVTGSEYQSIFRSESEKTLDERVKVSRFQKRKFVLPKLLSKTLEAVQTESFFCISSSVKLKFNEYCSS